MADPIAFMALLAIFLSIGAIAFASRSVTRLSEQYAEFARTHISALHAELMKKGKEQLRMIESFAGDVATNSKNNAANDREINEIKQRLAELIARLDLMEQDVNTRLPPRRVVKAHVLRSFGT